ncbi:hypothetical protein [Vibrio sp. WXL210]|uniref:hypothetical protein n=1 Tax=Vibrio sp. WXL210 TaxID=3450709 RepID=UPI003EC7EC32
MVYMGKTGWIGLAKRVVKPLKKYEGRELSAADKATVQKMVNKMPNNFRKMPVKKRLKMVDEFVSIHSKVAHNCGVTVKDPDNMAVFIHVFAKLNPVNGNVDTWTLAIDFTAQEITFDRYPLSFMDPLRNPHCFQRVIERNLASDINGATKAINEFIGASAGALMSNHQVLKGTNVNTNASLLLHDGDMALGELVMQGEQAVFMAKTYISESQVNTWNFGEDRVVLESDLYDDEKADCAA